MQYKQASITKKANVYHDGKVSSRSLTTAEGKNKTLGFMLEGSYTFNTQDAEIMEILAGECRVRLADTQNWHSYNAGESFHVPANSTFDIKVSGILDYICHFA